MTLVDTLANNIKIIILEFRRILRWHRDQIGDDRCWLDDYLVYEVAGIRQPISITNAPMGFKMSMKRCQEFHFFCNSERAPVIPSEAILDPSLWNEDLEKMSYSGLLEHFENIRLAVKAHSIIISRPKIPADYQKLYDLLPEKIPADFRLPPRDEFLRNKDNNRGCENFWLSHQNCAVSHCNLHQWGPCE